VNKWANKRSTKLFWVQFKTSCVQKCSIRISNNAGLCFTR